MTDAFMSEAIAEAEQGRREGGIPIGSVLVHEGRVLGQGHNRRVQRSSAILHGEMDAIQNAGRQRTYKDVTCYTTLSPCMMCTGTIIQFGISQLLPDLFATEGTEETTKNQELPSPEEEQLESIQNCSLSPEFSIFLFALCVLCG